MGAALNARHVTDATMRVRDVIYEGLLVRRGEALTEAVARERANNISTGVIEALCQMADEAKAKASSEINGAVPAAPFTSGPDFEI